jgi:hypothetical protein
MIADVVVALDQVTPAGMGLVVGWKIPHGVQDSDLVSLAGRDRIV